MPPPRQCVLEIGEVDLSGNEATDGLSQQQQRGEGGRGQKHLLIGAAGMGLTVKRLPPAHTQPEQGLCERHAIALLSVALLPADLDVYAYACQRGGELLELRSVGVAALDVQVQATGGSQHGDAALRGAASASSKGIYGRAGEGKGGEMQGREELWVGGRTE